MGGNELKTRTPMKKETSFNLLLIVFCVILIGFVLISTRMSDRASKRQTNKAQSNIPHSSDTRGH
jgi:hypothetical protein